MAPLVLWLEPDALEDVVEGGGDVGAEDEVVGVGAHLGFSLNEKVALAEIWQHCLFKMNPIPTSEAAFRTVAKCISFSLVRKKRSGLDSISLRTLLLWGG